MFNLVQCLHLVSPSNNLVSSSALHWSDLAIFTSMQGQMILKVFRVQINPSGGFHLQVWLAEKLVVLPGHHLSGLLPFLEEVGTTD